MQSKVYIRPHDLDLQLRTLQLKKNKILILNSQLFAPGTCFVLNQKKKKKDSLNPKLNVLIVLGSLDKLMRLKFKQ